MKTFSSYPTNLTSILLPFIIKYHLNVAKYGDEPVIFLGCGARCNTSIHGVEETLSMQPLYLLREKTKNFTLKDSMKMESSLKSNTSGIDFSYTNQRYERIVDLLKGTATVSLYLFLG